ncbi:MAG: hypothetical protein ACNI25_06125 [Halarcobacter sp.]
MKFIYIKNYLNVSRAKKYQFIKYIYSFDKFKVTNQKIILNDNSLILEFSSDSCFETAKTAIDKFFEDDKDIETIYVDKLIFEENELIILNEEKIINKVAI